MPPGDLPITIETRNRAATLAVGTTFLLTAGKFVVAFASGSVGVLSEAVHSLLDLVSASVSYFTVRHAVAPADANHHFGHGKIETLSSLFEALLLVLAGFLIIREGIDQLRNPHEIHYQGAAIGVMIVSLIASYIAYRHNMTAAAEVDSSALRVNALHFLSDVIASLGVLIGLIIVHFTGWIFVDAVMAFGVAGYIIAISLDQIRHTLHELSDAPLPQEDMEKIETILKAASDRTIEFHDLRTRKAGSQRHIDFHLVVCGQLTVDQSHVVCDELERKIKAALASAHVTIHVEPCELDRAKCGTDCKVSHRAQARAWKANKKVFV